MSGLEADTIGGFNSLIQKQKKEAGRAGAPMPVSWKEEIEADYEARK